MPFPTPALGEPFLLTLNPLTTSEVVKRAMLRGWGSWDDSFRAVTCEIRARLLAIRGSFVPHDGKVLVLRNGAYGQRITESLAYLRRNHTVIGKGTTCHHEAQR